VAKPVEVVAEPVERQVYRVDDPEGLIAVGRIRSLAQAFGMDGVPRALLDFRDSDEVKKNVLAELDWEGSFEIAVQYDPEAIREVTADDEFSEFGELDEFDEGFEPAEPEIDKGQVFVAFSAPLKRYEPAAYEKLGFTAGARGTFVHDECIISRAQGRAPARLICGDDLQSATRLHPFLAMGLPLQELSREPVYFQVRPGPLKGLWFHSRDEAEERLAEVPPTAGAMRELLINDGQAILREIDAWVRSLQSLEFSAGPVDGGLEFRTRIRTRDPQPWLLQAYQQQLSRTNGPPESFLALPGDVDGAGFSYGLAPEYSDVVRGAVTELLERLLAEVAPMFNKGGPGATFAPALELTRIATGPCVYSSNWVWARGDSKPMAAQQLTADELVSHVLGETLVAMPSSAQCGKLVNDMVDVIRSLEKAVRKERPKSDSDPLFDLALKSGAGPRSLPGSRTTSIVLSKAVLDEFRDDTDESEEALADEASSEQDAESKPEPEPKPKKTILPAKRDVKVTLITAQIGEFDWFALGTDPSHLERSLQRVRQPSDGGLKARADLATLFEPGLVSASFQTLPEYTQSAGALFDVPSAAFLMLPKGWQGAPIISRAALALRDGGLDATWSVRLPPQLHEVLKYLLSLPAEDFEALIERIEAEL